MSLFRHFSFKIIIYFWKKIGMKIYKHIPNFITLLNLSMGLIAIYLSLTGGAERLAMAGYFIFAAAIFDFFDGFAARLLNAKSEIGLQLDSLADMISFGAAPGFILFKMLSFSSGNYVIIEGINILSLFAFLIPWGAALRLAKFNIDDSQQTGFKGLPTPALAFFIASLPLIRQNFFDNKSMIYSFFTDVYFLISVAILGSFLMVSSLPMFALKFKSFGWKNNEIRYIFIVFALIMLVLWKIVAIPFIIFSYIILSLIIYLYNIKEN